MDVISKSKNGKSPWIDDITTELIKYAGQKLQKNIQVNSTNMEDWKNV